MCMKLKHERSAAAAENCANPALLEVSQEDQLKDVHGHRYLSLGSNSGWEIG